MQLVRCGMCEGFVLDPPCPECGGLGMVDAEGGVVSQFLDDLDDNDELDAGGWW